MVGFHARTQFKVVYKRATDSAVSSGGVVRRVCPSTSIAGCFAGSEASSLIGRRSPTSYGDCQLIDKAVTLYIITNQRYGVFRLLCWPCHPRNTNRVHNDRSRAPGLRDRSAFPGAKSEGSACNDIRPLRMEDNQHTSPRRLVRSAHWLQGIRARLSSGYIHVHRCDEIEDIPLTTVFVHKNRL